MKVAFVIDKIGFSVPLGLAYLSSILKSNGFIVDVFNVSQRSGNNFNALLRYQPDIIGYSVVTGTQKRYLEINKNLKGRLKFYSVFGGAHPTFFPEIIYKQGVDAVCRGEAEGAMVDFVKLVDNYREIPDNIANFWLKKGTTVFKNPVRNLIDNLDTLPYPDHKLFLDRFPSIRIFKRKEFIAHRGCPYRCAYCFNPEYNRLYKNNGYIYRARSPLKICDEIDRLRAFCDLKFVHFVDDVFTLDVKWLREFCAIYKQEVGIPFSLNMRLDNCSEEVVILLKKAECRLVYVGIESGSDFIRNKLMHRNMKRETITRNVKLLKRQGIRIITENILGLPCETYRLALKTLLINTYLKPDFADVSLFTPYPGLGLTEYAIKNNYFSGDFDNIDSVYYHSSNLKFNQRRDINRILNLRCFFSMLSKHRCLLPIFHRLSFIRYNRLFQIIGDLINGYYLYKLLPYRLSFRDFLRLGKVYISAYRK